MAKHLAPDKMGLAGEGLECWNKLEDKLASKVSQLTRLLHHFSAYPPEADASDSNTEIASQHESEIHDILNETASRIQQFKSALHIQAQDDHLQAAIEAMKKEHDEIQCATQNELKKAEVVANQLEESMKKGERALKDTITSQADSFAREIALQNSELQTKSEEVEQARLTSQQYRREIEELKKCHLTEMEHEKGKLVKVRQELVVISQSQLQLQAQEANLQDQLEEQRAQHTVAVKELETLQAAEIEKLKLKSFLDLEKLARDSASREADWQNEQSELQRQITVATEENRNFRAAAQESTVILRNLEEALTKEKESASKLQSTLNQAEKDLILMRETMKTASINNDSLAIALGTAKQEALQSKIGYNSAISKWEAVAVQLRQELETMTNTCSANEIDIKDYRVKVDELRFQLVTTRKELSLTKNDLEQLHKEIQKLNKEIESKDSQIHRIEDDTGAQNRSLAAEISRLQLECIAQNESSAQKVKDRMEIRMQQQSQEHESDLQTLRKTFKSQLEESRKEARLQLKAVADNLQRQQEEKIRAKGACEEFARALQEVQQKFNIQESKCLTQMVNYDTKIAAVINKLDSLEGLGLTLEEEVVSLSKQVLRHSTQSKQVGSIQQQMLREAREKCEYLECALVDLTRKCTVTTERNSEVVERLKQAIADQERAHEDALSANSVSQASQLKQFTDDVDRLKNEHSRATAQMQQVHEIELTKLHTTIQAQKSAEVVQERVRMDSLLQKNTLEINERMELMKLEYEKTLREQQDKLDETQKKYAKLLRTHLAVTKDQKEAAEAEIVRCQQANAQALTSCTDKWNQELVKLDGDRTKQLAELEQKHSTELYAMQASYEQKLQDCEDRWKEKLDLTEKNWQSRLRNESILWRIDRDNYVKDLRKSLLSSAAQEKNATELDHQARVCNLENRISELEISVREKDERVQMLRQDVERMDEGSKMLVLDLKTTHQGQLCDILEKQRMELLEVQGEGAAFIEELQEKHKIESEAARAELEKVKVQMKEKQIDLETKLEKLQERFVNRESRVEDVAHIEKLQFKCEQKDSTITKLNGRTNQLQLELYNREENYNKIFGQSPPPVLQQGMPDWLKPKSSAKVDGSKLSSTTKLDRNCKVDVGKVAFLQKRSASAARQMPKTADPTGRSASTLI